MRNKEYKRNIKLKSKKLSPANFLIVCEGKQTEPNYFNGLKKIINEKYGNKVDVLIPNIEIKGTGKNTTDLVNYTTKFVNYSNKRYANVWVVFDKDDYNDVQFDNAIKLCDYFVTWSNPNFELWLLLHLKKVNKFISKENILKELDKEFIKNKLGNYQKNDDKIFQKLSNNNGIITAINNSKILEKNNSNCNPSQCNPQTMVYKIVESLVEYLE